ncbi:hypothetical protein HD554DRAFT_2039797 [Boletus coccyginus]|nr:hypothetical protein HD554DRAFT_2039797 [Boletus coccyginus]
MPSPSFPATKLWSKSDGTNSPVVVMCLAPPMWLALPKPFPVELQWEIIMYLKDDPNTVRYALVAKHFYDWLAPYMYHIVELCGEIQALGFLHWLQGGLEHRRHQVKKLIVGRTVRMPMLANILDQCQALTSLEVRSSYYPQSNPETNPLLDPLDGLMNLTHMYISLAAYSEYATFPLPVFEVFRRLTHLHLSPWAVWKGSPIGFAELPGLTHLSLPFSLLTAKRSCAQAVQAFLKKESTWVVILWLTRLEFATVIERALRNAGIGGRRVVLFYYWARKSYELEDGGFWRRAEKVIAWREQNPDKSNDPLASSEWAGNPRPWNHYVPTC